MISSEVLAGALRVRLADLRREDPPKVSRHRYREVAVAAVELEEVVLGALRALDLEWDDGAPGGDPSRFMESLSQKTSGPVRLVPLPREGKGREGKGRDGAGRGVPPCWRDHHR